MLCFLCWFLLEGGSFTTPIEHTQLYQRTSSRAGIEFENMLCVPISTLEAYVGVPRSFHACTLCIQCLLASQIVFASSSLLVHGSYTLGSPLDRFIMLILPIQSPLHTLLAYLKHHVATLVVSLPGCDTEL